MSGKNKKKLQKLRDAGVFEKVDHKIKEGISIKEIARWIQEDLMLQTDIERSSLERKLYNYKSDLPVFDRMKAAAERTFLHETVEKMSHNLNEIRELEKMYLYQLKRISIDGKTEQKISKLFRSQSREIKLAVDILDRLMQKKMELGILDKAPDELKITGGLDGNFSVLDLERTELPEETGHKLGVAAQKILNAVIERREKEKEDSDDGEE